MKVLRISNDCVLGPKQDIYTTNKVQITSEEWKEWKSWMEVSVKDFKQTQPGQMISQQLRH